MPNLLAPTPSRGGPPPHWKISEPQSLGLCSLSCLRKGSRGPKRFLSASTRPGNAPEQLSCDMVKPFVLIEVRSVDALVQCLRISTGFTGIASERRIYESTLVRQPQNVSQKFKRIRRVSENALIFQGRFPPDLPKRGT